MGIISDKLEIELSKKLSILRLACTGLFVKIDIDPEDDLIRREIKLYRAVLDKALTDWFRSSKEIRKDVNDWLDLNNPDFQEVCERAFLKPEDVLEVFHTVRRILKGKNARFKKVGGSRKKKRRKK
jgi:hypothetical protein